MHLSLFIYITSHNVCYAIFFCMTLSKIILSCCFIKGRMLPFDWTKHTALELFDPINLDLHIYDLITRRVMQGTEGFSPLPKDSHNNPVGLLFG